MKKASDPNICTASQNPKDIPSPSPFAQIEVELKNIISKTENDTFKNLLEINLFIL